MDIQYIPSIIGAIVGIYINRMKILDFSVNNRIGKKTLGLVLFPVMFPIAIYKIGYWIKNDASFRKLYQKAIYQKRITDYFTI